MFFLSVLIVVRHDTITTFVGFELIFLVTILVRDKRLKEIKCIQKVGAITFRSQIWNLNLIFPSVW